MRSKIKHWRVESLHSGLLTYQASADQILLPASFVFDWHVPILKINAILICCFLQVNYRVRPLIVDLGTTSRLLVLRTHSTPADINTVIMPSFAGAHSCPNLPALLVMTSFKPAALTLFPIDWPSLTTYLASSPLWPFQLGLYFG